LFDINEKNPQQKEEEAQRTQGGLTPQNTNGNGRVLHMIVKTLDFACLLLEIRWQKGRHVDKMCTCTHNLTTFFSCSI
jgi:hypothetical protein